MGAMEASPGGLGLGHKELGDPGIGEPDQANLVVPSPGLRCDHLDQVVAIRDLQFLKVVIRAARAAGASDVHAHAGEAEDAPDKASGVGSQIARGVAEHREQFQGIGRFE